MSRAAWSRMMVALVLVGTSALAGGVGPAQVDDFEDGTTMDWAPFTSNVTTGGPLGSGDNFLQVTSAGGSGAGSRMVAANQAQWAGDWNAAGATMLLADLKNLGSGTLAMRIGVADATTSGPSDSSNRYVSTSAVSVPADGVWHAATFDLSAMSSVQTGSTPRSLSQVLGNVLELRLIAAAGGPAWQGDAIAATLGVDNVRLMVVPVELQTFTVE